MTLEDAFIQRGEEVAVCLTLESAFSKKGEEAIAHYGAKGMKWGIRKSDEERSRDAAQKEKSKTEQRETKAEKFEAKAKLGETRIADIDREIASLSPGFRGNYKRADLQGMRATLDRQANANRKDAESVREGKLTSTQKKLIVGGVVVGGVLVAMGVQNMQQTGQLNSIKLRGEAFLKGKEFDFLKNSEFARKDLSPDDVLSRIAKGVNPGYSVPGGKMNCRRASFAYEMRRRGYDVVATTSPVGAGQTESGLINALTIGGKDYTALASLSSKVASGEGIRARLSGDNRLNPADIFSVKNELTTWTPDSPDSHSSFAKSLLSSFTKYSDGNRGEVVFDFEQFGHSMSWEMFDGKPHIFDTQKGVKYDITNPFEYYSLTQKWGMPKAAEATRLDNMTLDKKFVSRWITNSPR
jgi:hypothetical protein